MRNFHICKCQLSEHVSTHPTMTSCGSELPTRPELVARCPGSPSKTITILMHQTSCKSPRNPEKHRETSWPKRTHSSSFMTLFVFILFGIHMDSIPMHSLSPSKCASSPLQGAVAIWPPQHRLEQNHFYAVFSSAGFKKNSFQYIYIYTLLNFRQKTH